MHSCEIGLGHYLAYGSGDFLGAGTTALNAAWLLWFYTTFCGLTPIQATFIFAAARAECGGESGPRSYRAGRFYGTDEGSSGTY